MHVALITPDRAYHAFVAFIIEGLRARGDTFFASDPGNTLTAAEVRDPEAFMAECRARPPDAVLVFFGKVGSHAAGPVPTREPRYELVPELPVPSDHIAYLDYSEMTASGREMPGQIEAMKPYPGLRRGTPWLNLDPRLAKCGHYFKRECFLADTEAGVRPMAYGLLAAYEEPVPRQGKDWDLYCSFGHTATGLRREVVTECQRLRAVYRDKKIVVRDRVPLHEYRQSMARSKIVVDAWGHGDHCYRIWEGVGAQACVLYQRYQVLTGPDWFVEGEEAVSYGTIKEFRQRAEALLALPEETMAIGRRGYKMAKAQHTGRARVEYIFRTMGVLA